MIETAGKYRIVSNPESRVLEIQDAVTWAPISTLSVPDDPRVFAAVRKGIGEICGAEAKQATPKTASKKSK